MRDTSSVEGISSRRRLVFFDIGEIRFDDDPSVELALDGIVATVEPEHHAIAEEMVAAYNAMLEAK